MPYSFLIDGGAWADGNDFDGSLCYLVDDSKVADSQASETFHLFAQGLSKGRVLQEGIQASPDLGFERRMKGTEKGD